MAYRSAAELLLFTELEDEPATALDAARVLLARIDDTLRGLTE